MISGNIEMKDLIKQQIDKVKNLEIERLNKRDKEIEDFIKSKNTDEIKAKLEELEIVKEERISYVILLYEDNISDEEKKSYKNEIEKLEEYKAELEKEIGFNFYKIEEEYRKNCFGKVGFTKLSSIPLNELFYVLDGNYDAFISKKDEKYYMNVIVTGLQLMEDHISERDITKSYLEDEWVMLNISLYINEIVESSIRDLIEDKDKYFPY